MIRFPEIIPLDGATLRPLTMEDAVSLHRLTNDPRIADIISFLSYPVPESFVEEWIGKNEGTTDRVYGIFSDGTVLMGQIGMHVTDNPSEIEIGYWIGIDFWGKGLATKAASGLAREATALNGEQVVIAECLPDNLASMRVLEKSGFCSTGQPGHRAGRTRLVWAG